MSTPEILLRDFDRGMLRSGFVSLFAGIMMAKKRSKGFTFQKLADALGVDKSSVSRDFRGDPNWTVNKIADLANALDVEISIQARDRVTGAVFTPAGPATSRVGMHLEYHPNVEIRTRSTPQYGANVSTSTIQGRAAYRLLERPAQKAA